MKKVKLPQKQAGTGTQFEKDFFGVSPEYPESMSYKKFTLCIDKVRIAQNRWKWNATAPSTPLSAILFDAVRKNLTQAADPSMLRLCCALGSELDYFHGVDGFFYIEQFPHDTVTFDLSVNTSKSFRRIKANFLIRPQDMSIQENVEGLATAIAEQLEQNLILSL